MDKTVYTVLGMYIQCIRSIPAGSIETLSWMEWCFTGFSTEIDACLKQPSRGLWHERARIRDENSGIESLRQALL